MSGTEPVRLHPEWLEGLNGEFEQDYMRELSGFLRQRKAERAAVYPPGGLIFNALDSTPPSAVRAVILGQDPYHGPGQAHGLCFSVRPGVPVPPSLANIYRELHSDIGFEIPAHGCLQAWAERGVLLLNAVLTVERGRAGAHQGKGWERFTDRVVEVVNALDRPLVFFLWGAHAQRKGAGIDRDRHLVLTAPHPSPLSAHRGFLGCQHFSRANQWLSERGEPPLDWTLPAQPPAA
ncbi:MAG: uracil-DNA glycosylase [Wenzhouxiangellaceae bacterium]|nr:uracil-DNA glycosylase [Wenzhouxiangellaceae bacterium]